MKATIDIPDELYRRVKAQSAMLGRPVREVTIELYRRWLGDVPAETSPQTAEQWLADWQDPGDSLLGRATDGPTASDVLAADRDRLERLKIVNIYEAKTHLSRLLREVALGEDIVIAKDGRPLARLVPVAAEDGERDLGFAAGRVVVSADFDAPLPTELQAGFDADTA